MEQKLFLLRLQELVEKAEGQGRTLERDEITETLPDLTEEQFALVAGYLAEHQIRVRGVVGPAEEKEEQETMAELEELAAESPFFADYLAKMKRLPILDEEEEDALYQKACEGDEKARENLLESRLPMVAEAALLYRDQGSRMEDLMQEGSLGLILGLETAMAEEVSDWRKTVLTTVMETLEQAVYEDNAQVSVARKSVERAQSVRDAAKSFETEFGYEASKEALAGYLEMEAEELESILKLGADEKDFLSGRQEENDNEQ